MTGGDHRQGVLVEDDLAGRIAAEADQSGCGDDFRGGAVRSDDSQAHECTPSGFATSTVKDGRVRYGGRSLTARDCSTAWRKRQLDMPCPFASPCGRISAVATRRGPSHDHSCRISRAARADTNPYPYGYRYVQRAGTNGEVVHDQVPLTLEDVLHPLEDDVISENTDHNTDRDYIKRACLSRLRRVTGALVMSDCIIDWDHPTIRPMSPDVSVIFDVADPNMRRGTFYTAREGTWPSAVVEIVSPHSRTNDIRKIDLYYQLEIPEYVLIDQERDDGPRALIHRRWEPTGWVETRDGGNGVVIQAANVRLRLRDDHVVCFDATTDAEILDFLDLEEDRDELREDRDELREANTQLQETLEATERKLRDQACAREDAERKLREEARAREDAERKLRDQARADKDAERRVRDLEAELRRLRGEPPA